jgi:hypothetical protein
MQSTKKDASAVPVRLAGKEACEWARRTPRRPHEVPPVGAEARREDHQSAALFFRWFLRILTSNLESRRPTSSLTRMKVSLSRPSAFRHPWPTCQQFGPSAWHLYLHLHHVELKIFFAYRSASPIRTSKGTVQAALHSVGNVGRQQTLGSCCFKMLKRLGSYRRMECWTLEMTVRQASPRC